MAIIYKGKEYKSYKQLTEMLNLNYNTFRTRLYQGYTVDQALLDRESFKRLRNKDNIIEIDGKTFNNITDFMHYYGVNKKRAEEILQGNLDIHNLDDSYDGWKSIDVVIEGKHYSSWKEIVNDYPNNNLTPDLVANRYNQLSKRGLDLVRPKMHTNRSKSKNDIGIEIDDIHFDSLRQAAIFFNFSYDAMKTRYHRGIRGLDLIKPYKKRLDKLNKFKK